MRYLNGIDYSVIGLYCLVLLALGILLQRRASRSLEHYFLAGRNLPWWALGISGMTNFLDMAGTMLIVSFLFMLGPRGLYIEFRGGAVLVLAFMLLWTGKWHYRSRCMTFAEWQIYRFGTSAGAQAARVIFAAANIMLMIGLLAYLTKGAGIFLSMFIPLPPMYCAAAMVALTTLYTIVSGFYGVVYNDLFQSGVILISVLIITIMAMSRVFGYDGDLGLFAQQVTGNAQWLSSFPHWKTEMPKGYENFMDDDGVTLLALIAGFYLLRNVLAGFGQTGADQRYFGARSERECGLLTFFWTWLMTFRWPMMMGFAVLGLFLIRDMYPDRSQLTDAAAVIRQAGDVPKEKWETRVSDITQNPDAYPDVVAGLERIFGQDEWRRKVQLVSHEGTVNPERILPAVILMQIPAGLRGLFIASLLAAAMSTLSPQVNCATSFFTRDIYQAYLRRRASTRELIYASYVFGVVTVAVAFVLAYHTQSINTIWDWIIMGLGGGVAIPWLLRFHWWRFNGSGVFWGTLAGLIGSVIQGLFFNDWSPDRKFLVCTAAGGIGAILGTYLAPPTERPVLEHFYKTTRPFGFWAPLRPILRPDVRQAMDRENRNDLLGLPFALTWQITLFLLPMQAVIGSWYAFRITLLIFLTGLAGVMWFWWRNLPSADAPQYPSSLLMGAEQFEPSPALAAVAPEGEKEAVGV